MVKGAGSKRPAPQGTCDFAICQSLYPGNPQVHAGAPHGGEKNFFRLGPGNRPSEFALRMGEVGQFHPFWKAAVDSPRSVAFWIEQLQAGDAAAAEQIWRRYGGRLLGLARKRLVAVRCRAADEEDVVQSAFLSFCRGAAKGQFAAVDDRESLWKLLQTLVHRKATDQRQHEMRQKRGGGAVRGESAVAGGPDPQARGLAQITADEPNPARQAETTEVQARLLAILPDDTLRAIAQWKVEGYTNEEIAVRLGCARSTVVRKLDLIREIWRCEVEQ